MIHGHSPKVRPLARPRPAANEQYHGPMYAAHFGLKREPFSIAPDSRYLFMSARHRDALAHLLYGLDRGGGFVLLTGEVGAGKTTVCRRFLKKIPPHVNVAYILNPKCTVIELLRSICREYGVPPPNTGYGKPTPQDYIDALNDYLLRMHAAGQSNILIVDEAQNLSMDVLEQLRLLTNLETDDRKLLQILLIGQPELREMLARPEMRQLAQRVIARFHLGPLSATETEQYIRFRLKMAGKKSPLPFTRNARKRIYELSGGVPRRINLLADRALLAAYGARRSRADSKMVESAAKEVFVEERASRRRPSWWNEHVALLATVGVSALLLLLVLLKATGVIGAAPVNETPTHRLASPAGEDRPPGPMVFNPPAEQSGGASPAGRPLAPAANGVVVPTIVGPAAQRSSAGLPAKPVSFSRAELSDRFPLVARVEQEAWRELAVHWNLAVGDEDPCVAAEREDIYCYKSRADLSLIRALDRPGIVTLFDDKNTRVYALLIGVTDNGVTLTMAGALEHISLASFFEMWKGDFATLWRAFPGYSEKAAEARTGPVLDRLATMLATAEGHPTRVSGVSQAEFKPRLQAFQATRGLPATGVPGPLTMMQLNRANGIDEPQLKGGR